MTVKTRAGSRRAFALCALLCLLLAGCARAPKAAEAAAAVSEDAKFGAAILSLSPEAFEAAGFHLGDSCDVAFGNGYTLNDVPYFNGYYVKNGAPVIVAYPGFGTVSITLNNRGIWAEAGLTDGEAVTVRLHEAGKYAALQEALGQSYSFRREDYGSDEEFVNFRALSGGALKAGFLYRGASPVDNSRGRAACADGLLAANGIRFVLDLADSPEDMEAYRAAEDFASLYAGALYDEGRAAFLDMSSAYESADYRQKVAGGLRTMLGADGPVYIHCMEGKDRTGFVCMLLEALAGADYDEMLADYMTTYRNYYGVSPEETPEKYAAIAALYFDSFAAALHGTEDVGALRAADYAGDAEAYLLAGGLSEEEVRLLRAFITEP